jgi:hypothetical protein
MASAIDEDLVRDIHLTIINDGALHSKRQRVAENLTKKWAKGTYDHAKAPKAWEYWVKEGIVSYKKKFPGTKVTAAERREISKRIADEYLEELKLMRKSNPTYEERQRIIEKTIASQRKGGRFQSPEAVASTLDTMLTFYDEKEKSPAKSAEDAVADLTRAKGMIEKATERKTGPRFTPTNKKLLLDAQKLATDVIDRLNIRVQQEEVLDPENAKRIEGHFEDIVTWAEDLQVEVDTILGAWQNNPKKKARASSTSAAALVKRCQTLWTAYCKQSTKANLLKVWTHLEKMKQSKAATVKRERSKCLRVFNAEWKAKGYKDKPPRKKVAKKKAAKKNPVWDRRQRVAMAEEALEEGPWELPEYDVPAEEVGGRETVEEAIARGVHMERLPLGAAAGAKPYDWNPRIKCPTCNARGSSPCKTKAGKKTKTHAKRRLKKNAGENIGSIHHWVRYLGSDEYKARYPDITAKEKLAFLSDLVTHGDLDPSAAEWREARRAIRAQGNPGTPKRTRKYVQDAKRKKRRRRATRPSKAGRRTMRHNPVEGPGSTTAGALFVRDPSDELRKIYIANPDEWDSYAVGVARYGSRGSGLLEFQVGAMALRVAVWSSGSLDESLETLAGWLAEHAPGHITNHSDMEELVQEVAAERGVEIDELEEWQWQEPEYAAIREAAEVDLTWMDSAQGWMTNEWRYVTVEPTSQLYREVLEASAEHEEDRDEEAFERAMAATRSKNPGGYGHFQSMTPGRRALGRNLDESQLRKIYPPGIDPEDPEYPHRGEESATVHEYKRRGGRVQRLPAAGRREYPDYLGEQRIELEILHSLWRSGGTGYVEAIRQVFSEDITDEHFYEVIEQLERRRLAKVSGDSIVLTGSGQAEALKFDKYIESARIQANPNGKKIKVTIEQDMQGNLYVKPESDRIRKKVEKHLATLGERGADVFVSEGRVDTWIDEQIENIPKAKRGKVRRGVAATFMVDPYVFGMWRGWDTEHAL